jgi:hypothetical protein
MKYRFHKRIKLDVVDIQTAKSLYEAGFKFDTNYWYNLKQDTTGYHLYFRANNKWSTYPCIIPAPELELLSKWLMDEYNVNITICLLKKEVTHSWYYNIDYINEDKIIHHWNPKLPSFDTYEKALDTAVKSTLKFLKIIQ